MGRGCLIALIAGTMLIKSLGRDPGVEKSFYTFPRRAGSYGLLMGAPCADDTGKPAAR